MRNETLGTRTITRMVRVCSGGCAYFQPVYESGRKVAGAGTCSRFASEASVKVGITCLWSPSVSTASQPAVTIGLVEREAVPA